MMGIAASNIALPSGDHTTLLAKLVALGITGLEVAPSRVWRDTWRGLNPHDIDSYRRQVESAGLQVVGLHSLFFDHPELGLFAAGEGRKSSIDFLTHLSRVCRDLGGRTMIWGGNRWRKTIPMAAAYAACHSILHELLPRIETHGTKLCFEPLGPRDTDFLNSAADCISLVEEIDHPALGIQLDAKALVDNAEDNAATFERVQGRLDHFHANDPGLVAVGSTNIIDHHALGAHLGAIGYSRWVSIEQRMIDEKDPMAPLTVSAMCVRQAYMPGAGQ